MEELKNKLSALIEAKRDIFIDAADRIWATPEVRFATDESVKPYYEILTKEGFHLEKGLANMKNCFVATAGSGNPVIGILAEYDALNNLSQVADATEQKPIVKGGSGHGCGHNLLGTGALAAAVGLKELMETENIKGTIKLFGCPSEESGYGKAFMARDGLFKGVDVALSWHPNDASFIWGGKSMAVYQLYFNFKGIASHAAAMPEKGRSALDAAEMMNVGVQFLREHIIDEGRIHYAFIDAGGESANVVQPTASLYYFIRAPKSEQAHEILERVKKIAEGAALMTGTELDIEFDSACLDYMPNKTLSADMYENLKDYGKLDLTPEDMNYEQRYFNTLEPSVVEDIKARAKKYFKDEKLGEQPMLTKELPFDMSLGLSGSTDVSDVSWNIPTAQVFVGCEPQGSAFHSWQWAANGKSDVAHKGMLAAGKVIATTALDVLLKPELLTAANKEHLENLNGKTYQSAIPKDVMPG
jgi:aminobenzoyl-glutamate utilization protein B